MRTAVVLTLLILLSGNRLLARGGYNGKEAEDWEAGNLYVLVGVIHHIQPTKNRGEYRATFAPKATLGGIFDPSLHPTIPLIFYVDPPDAHQENSIIPAVPPGGATILAVVEHLRIVVHLEERRYTVASGGCPFMPDQGSLSIVKGLDDPKIAQTLRKLQDARAHPNPNPVEERSN